MRRVRSTGSTTTGTNIRAGRPEKSTPHGWQAILGVAGSKRCETGVALEAELSLLGKDGQYRPFLTRVVPLRNSAGTVYGWIGTHIDISERKRSEREVHRRQGRGRSRVAASARDPEFADRGREARGARTARRRCRARDQQSAWHQPDGRFFAGAKVQAVCLGGRGRNAQALEPERFRRCRAGRVRAVLVSLNRAAGLVQSFKQVAADRNNSDLRSFDLGELTEQLAIGLRPALPKHGVSLNVQCQPVCR